MALDVTWFRFTTPYPSISLAVWERQLELALNILDNLQIVSSHNRRPAFFPFDDSSCVEVTSITNVFHLQTVHAEVTA